MTKGCSTFLFFLSWILITSATFIFSKSVFVGVTIFSFLNVILLSHMNFNILNIKNYNLKSFFSKTFNNVLSSPFKDIETSMFFFLFLVVLISPILGYLPHSFGFYIAVPPIMFLISYILLNRVMDDYRFKNLDDNEASLLLSVSCCIENFIEKCNANFKKYIKESKFFVSNFILEIKLFIVSMFHVSSDRFKSLILENVQTVSFLTLSFSMVLLTLFVSPVIGLLGFLGVFSVFVFCVNDKNSFLKKENIEEREPSNKLDIYWRDALLVKDFPSVDDFHVALNGDLTTYLATSINDSVYIYCDHGLELCNSADIDFWIPIPLLMETKNKEVTEQESKCDFTKIANEIKKLEKGNLDSEYFSEVSLLKHDFSKGHIVVKVKGNKSIIDTFTSNNWLVSRRFKDNDEKFYVWVSRK